MILPVDPQDRETTFPEGALDETGLSRAISDFAIKVDESFDR